MSLLITKSLSIGYQKTNLKVLQKDINLSLKQGEIISLMGQNGVGKTTFIKTIAGLMDAIDGTVQYSGKNLDEISANELARKMSLVLTERPFTFNMTPIELIAVARHPYSNWMGVLSKKDKDAIEWAITETNLNYIAERKLYELSDGQLQKVMIARALAQETDLIILDEPAAHLDLNNKIEVMLLLRKIAAKGKGILISTHDLQVSTQLSDKILLFNFNEEVIEGTPEDLILNGKLEKGLFIDGYGYDMIHGTININQAGQEVQVVGDPTSKFWVEMSLKRKGYKIVNHATEIQIDCKSNQQFHLNNNGSKSENNTVEELLKSMKGS